MKFGLFAINYGTCATPENAVRVARHAEAAGFESVWTGEHLVLPSPQPDDLTMPPTLPFMDTIVALTLLASNTTTIKLASGIIQLPLHHPVILAKQLACVDRMSAGRLMVGIGAGYLEAEFAAMGVPLAERGRRMDEHLDAMRALWGMPQPEFHGRHIEFAGVDAHPRPLRPSGPPIVAGGIAPAARRRAITKANGWYLFNTDRKRASEAVEVIRAEQAELDRPAELGSLELTMTPVGRFDRETAEWYEELGVDRIVLLPKAGRTSRQATRPGTGGRDPARHRHRGEHHPPAMSGRQPSMPGRQGLCPVLSLRADRWSRWRGYSGQLSHPRQVSGEQEHPEDDQVEHPPRIIQVEACPQLPALRLGERGGRALRLGEVQSVRCEDQVGPDPVDEIERR